MMSLPLRSKFPGCYLYCSTQLSVVARLVGERQVGQLLLVALKGMLMQRRGADSDLVTCVARLVDLNGS